MNKIIFIVGLTAVGKTTTINALKNTDYKLLPNRRALTDLIIIPEIQKDLGQKLIKVTDRIERFAITAKYRQKHPEGIVHALKSYLHAQPKSKYFFDNIRGLNELQAASLLGNSYFVFLDATNIVRLQRLIGRNDSFDSTGSSPNNNLVLELSKIPNAAAIFDLEKISELANNASDHDKIISAIKIITTENSNYDSAKAKEFLYSLASKRYIYIDTGKNTIAEVKELTEGFINGIDN